MQYKFCFRLMILVLVFFVAGTTKIMAQEGMNFEEIRVIAPYEPTISDAFKILHNPAIPDTIIPARNLEFNILPKLHSTHFDVDPLNPARMKGEPLTKLYRGFVKGGLGTGIMPYGELFFSNLRSNNIVYQARAKHLSSGSNIGGFGNSAFSDNLIEINGKKFFEKTSLSGGLFYKRNVVHYYGYQSDSLTSDPLIAEYLENLSKDDIRQRYQTVGGQIGFGSSHLDSSKVMHNSILKYSYSDNLGLPDDYGIDPGNIREHFFGYDGKIGFLLPPDPFGFAEKQYFTGEVKTHLYNHHFPFDSLAYTTGIVSLKPQLSSQYKDFRFTIGLDISIEADTTSYMHFYPLAYVEANLIDKVLVAYGGIKGSLDRNSFRSLSEENPFVNENLNLGFSNKRVELSGGFKGSVSSYVAYNLQVINAVVDKYAFFVTDTSSILGNEYTTVFDNVNIFQLRGEISSQIRERFNIRLCADYYKFTMENELEAWHRPPLEITLGVMYNMRDKIILRADVFARNSSYGKAYDETGQVVAQKIHGFHVDANVGIEYRYTKKLGAFLNLYNVQNQSYYRWLNYPGYKFNFMGGISYSF